MSEQRILRVRKSNAHNWVIEEYQVGGEEITRGKYLGQLTQAKWDKINPLGYFSDLKWAAKALMDEHLQDSWPTDGWTGADLFKAIEEAEARTLAVIEKALANPKAE